MLTELPYNTDPQVIDECAEICMHIDPKTVLNKPTGDFFYDPWTIKEDFRNSLWDKLLSTIPCDIGEARVIRLLPGEAYMAHADIDDRWHINLTGDQSYLIDLNIRKMFLLNRDYKWYSMDAGKIHVATNFGSEFRFQVVVRQLLLKSAKNDLVSVTIIPNGSPHDYRYKFDKIISPFLNLANKKSMLSDFHFTDKVVKFKLSMSMVPKLKKIQTQDFIIDYA